MHQSLKLKLFFYEIQWKAGGKVLGQRWGRGAGGGYRGTSLLRNSAPLKDHHRTLVIILLKGPMSGLFLMSEVKL